MSHSKRPRKRRSRQRPLSGMIAAFDSAPELYQAAHAIRNAGFQRWDTFTPFPMHGMDKAMGLKRSRVPVFTFCGGLIGFSTGMFLSWYMGEVDYPLIVGGKPFFSPIFTFPIAYELMILLAAFGTLIGMFLLNLLPQPYHPIFNFKSFDRASDDAFLLFIEGTDPLFDREATRSFLEKRGGRDVTLVFA